MDQLTVDHRRGLPRQGGGSSKWLTVLGIAGFLLAGLQGGTALAPRESRAQTAGATYADVEPIFAGRCVVCHGGASPAAGLRLDSLEGLKAGSRNGTVAMPGDPSGSELVKRLKGISSPRMPMTGPPFLSDGEIALVERWISAGMPAGSASGAGRVVTGPPAAPKPSPGEPVTFAHVAPIFASRCVKCHADSGLMGPAPEGFRLTSHEATVSTADRVRVVPGYPLASELYRRVRGLSRKRMPLDGPPYLSDDEIKLIEDWIRDGARDSSGAVTQLPVGARVRLNGTLGPNWTLDGLKLNVTGGTRLDKSPGTGDHVEVRGSIGAGGAVQVERLRRR